MDTIVACSTATGPALRAIVRLSGPRSIEIADQVRSGPLTAALQTFRRPRSATGEDVAELHVPGIPPLVARLVEDCLAAGARAAGPGEFTRRALANGRLDPAQAEAVAALVSARDEAERRGALAVLRGDLSRRVDALRERLLDLVARAEAEIDFVEEDLGAPLDVSEPIRGIREAIAGLLASWRRRSTASETARIVLCGRTNVGKSSLWNRLTRSRALVSDAWQSQLAGPGTTRDPLEAHGLAGGRPAVWVDTAGETASAGDLARRAVAMGVEERERADALVWVIDGTPDGAEREAISRLPADRTVIAANKCDLGACDADGLGLPVVRTSAVTREGLGRLRRAVGRVLDGGAAGASPLLVTSRVSDALRRADAALSRAGEAEGLELAAADLREALDALGEVAGRASSEEVLGRIFSSFCIGK
ncbi:MAG: GTPase [Planctomycetota bacterium]